jgi:uncharacterized OsmC-like protein
MLSEPRRIGKIEINLHLQGKNISEKDRTVLEKIGDNCPVMKSLHPDLAVETVYVWE